MISENDISYPDTEILNFGVPVSDSLRNIPENQAIFIFGSNCIK